MNPQTARLWLQYAAAAFALGGLVVAKLQAADLNSTTAILVAIATAVAGFFGKASEAPGGIARWKIPEHLEKQIPK